MGAKQKIFVGPERQLQERPSSNSIQLEKTTESVFLLV